MSWREATAIVWLGFSLGALTDTALRWRMPRPPDGGRYDSERSGRNDSDEPSGNNSNVRTGSHSDRTAGDDSDVRAGRNSHAGAGFSRPEGHEAAATAT